MKMRRWAVKLAAGCIRTAVASHTGRADSLEDAMSGSHDPLTVDQDAATPVAHLPRLWVRESEGDLPRPLAREGGVASHDPLRQGRVVVEDAVPTVPWREREREIA